MKALLLRETNRQKKLMKKRGRDSTDSAVYTELKCGTNFAYLLNDSSCFQRTEYKVLQNQKGGVFLRSMKMTYNGQTELYYMTDGCTALSSLVTVLDTDRFLAVAGSLLDAVYEVKHNGFLVCSNLDLSWEKIFVDTSTCKVRLVYLPVRTSAEKNDRDLETELRRKLISEISRRKDQDQPEVRKFLADLSDSTRPLEETAARLRGKSAGRSALPVPPAAPAVRSMRLITAGVPRKEIKITKDEFLIGKKAAAVDAVVDFNRMISRVHCKVCRNSSGYTVMDMDSANGTFLNHKRLVPRRAYPLKNGDVLRMADTDFQVMIR